MSVFNPKILEASIRDVTTELADVHKVDVLIYGMQHLQLDRSVCLAVPRVHARLTSGCFLCMHAISVPCIESATKAPSLVLGITNSRGSHG